MIPLLAYADISKTPQSRVLILNSYSKGYAWTDNVIKGIEDVLLKEPNIVLITEYMDTKILNTPEYYELLKTIYITKYANRKFDLIISTDDDALKFLRKHRDEIFPNTPVIFSGVNNFTPVKVEGFSLFTGVNEQADFTANLELIAKLHPNVNKIFVINDQMTTAKFLKKEFDTAAENFKETFEFVYLDQISMPNLKTKLAYLPRDSLVFYLSFFKDIDGKTFTPSEAIPQIAKASRRPIYGAVDYMIGHGIVGGLLKSSYYQGETAGRLAMEYFRGKAIGDIPVVIKSPNQYMFDFRMLEQFGVPMKLLPGKSIIINEPESFYYKYKKLIWSAVTVFVALLGFIVVLLFNIQKRKRAQHGLHTIISSTASIFDYQSSESFEKEIKEHLKALMPTKGNFLFLKQNIAEAKKGKFIPLPAGKEDRRAVMKLTVESTDLLADAFLKKKCLVKGQGGVAFLNSDNVPGNMILMECMKKLDDLDRDLLEIFAQNVTMSIENIEKHKMQKALDTAKNIQMSMLPTNFEEFSQKYSIDLHAFLRPAKEVGGDLYDFFAIDSDHLCLTVGDVSDKGVPAALFMAMAKSLIRSAAEGNLNTDAIISKVNNELSRNNDQAMFVTVFLAILNITTGELRYTSAGHNPPYIIKRSGEIRMLEPIPGMVIGGFEGSPYSTESTKLEKGDGLYIYSDGVTEAMNKAKDLYDESRLEEALKINQDAQANTLNEKILDDLERFIAGAPQSDDITMLFVRV